MRFVLRSLPVLTVLVLALLVTGCRPRTDAAVTSSTPPAVPTCGHDCDCGCVCDCGCCGDLCQ